MSLDLINFLSVLILSCRKIKLIFKNKGLNKIDIYTDMRSKTRQALQEDYEYYENQPYYVDVMNNLERLENKEKYKMKMTDNELRNYIDNNYFEETDNYERYGLEFMNNEVEETEDGRKYVIYDYDYDMNEYGDEFKVNSFIYLDEEDKGKKKLTLEDSTKRSIIRKIKNIDTKMKLIQPEIYNDTRKFYLTIFKKL